MEQKQLALLISETEINLLPRRIENPEYSADALSFKLCQEKKAKILKIPKALAHQAGEFACIKVLKAMEVLGEDQKIRDFVPFAYDAIENKEILQEEAVVEHEGTPFNLNAIFAANDLTS